MIPSSGHKERGGTDSLRCPTQRLRPLAVSPFDAGACCLLISGSKVRVLVRPPAFSRYSMQADRRRQHTGNTVFVIFATRCHPMLDDRDDLRNRDAFIQGRAQSLGEPRAKTLDYIGKPRAANKSPIRNATADKMMIA
jgi:hypothetical protein